MISLAMSYDMPEGPVKAEMPDVHYPTFHVESKEEIDFPHEGEMTIKFKKIGSEMSEREGRPPRYSCTIEVRGIVSMEGDEETKQPTKSGTDAGAALDALMKKMMKGRKEDY